MIQWIILALVLVSIYMLYKIWKKSQIGANQSNKAVKLSYSPDELRLENVGPGGMVQLSRIGEGLDDYDVSILSKHIYRQGESTWYELEGDKGDEKVWIEFEEDDELEISLKQKELKFRDLGIKKSDLERIDDEEEGYLNYEGEKFYYEDSDEAIFYRNGIEEKAEKYYYWDFENDDGTKFISVEKWSGKDYEVTYSIPLKESQIMVYSLKKGK